MTHGGPLDSFRMGAGHRNDSPRDERVGISAQPPNSRGRGGLETVLSHMVNNLFTYVTKPQQELWTLSLSTVSCSVNALMCQEDDTPSSHEDRRGLGSHALGTFPDLHLSASSVIKLYS